MRLPRDLSGLDLAARAASGLPWVIHRSYIRPRGAMPTAKKRINITVGEDVYEALERLAAERHQPVAAVGLSLIEQALEYQEDVYFSRVADERLGRRQKRITHAKAWE